MLMKKISLFVGLILVASAVALQDHEPHTNGVIYGTAIANDGQPARNVRLLAVQIGMGSGLPIPQTKTNDAGQYRFENLPWWGSYQVVADDQEAGYSNMGGPPFTGVPHVEITLEHREEEFDLFLPPKYGFLKIQLTNRRTGKSIPSMHITVIAAENPKSPLFSTYWHSRYPVLLPPDKDLLLHITADGFHEWGESVGEGKLLLLASGTKRTIVAQLEPAD